MIENLPNYINLLFIGIALIAIIWVYKASQSKIVLMLLIVWLVVMSLVGLSGFLPNFEAMPSRILVGVIPPVLLILILFFTKKTWGQNMLLIWNITALVLLITIVVISVLSAPSPFQQLSFDQPNLAIFYFPFNLLPSLIVPMVMFGHLISIRRLIIGKSVLN